MRTQSPLRIRALSELISGFLEGLADLGFKPVRSVLYGSYAKGHPHAYSDVDLAIWTDPEMPWEMRENASYLRLLSRYQPVSPKFYGPDETAADDPFIGEVLRTGKEIPLSEKAIL